MLKPEYTDDDARKAVAAMTLARAVFARGHTSEAQVLADGIDALRKRILLLEQQRDEARAEVRQLTEQLEVAREAAAVADDRAEWHRSLVGGSTWWRP